MVTDAVLGIFPDALNKIVATVRRLSGNPNLKPNFRVAASESEHCSLEMSVEDLARAGYFLMNQGVPLGESEPFISSNQAKYINSLMLTCGTYDSVGDLAYRVGLPGKSGVGGGILAVMPGQFSVAVWSPGLDASGNSLVGTLALELLTTKTGVSVF